MLRFQQVGHDATAYCHHVWHFPNVEPRHCGFEVSGTFDDVRDAARRHYDATGHWDISLHERVAHKGKNPVDGRWNA